jgi:hypothetical protein
MRGRHRPNDDGLGFLEFFLDRQWTCALAKRNCREEKTGQSRHNPLRCPGFSYHAFPTMLSASGEIE